jgi:hypothetical protein
MKQPRTLREPATRSWATVVAMVVALALAALRCSVDIPLGVDPHSDAADNLSDAGAGN